jgi:hypothetical protein
MTDWTPTEIGSCLRVLAGPETQTVGSLAIGAKP